MALKDHSDTYADIIDLPHHVSKTRPKMSMHDRAAQFSPFAALTGYDAAIRETARHTGEKMDLDETVKAFLDEKFRYLMDVMQKSRVKPEVSVTFFQKDEKKDGGAYIRAEGQIRKVDLYEKVIVMEDRQTIRIEDIAELDSDIFRTMVDSEEEMMIQ